MCAELGEKPMRGFQATEAGTAYDSFVATRYFSGLDALRAISVIAVIWTHATINHQYTLLTQGNRGVDLFFAISGFLVTTLLLREYARNGEISLRDFYIRRTLRIFPLYYAVLLVYIVLVAVTLRGTPKAAEFWANLPAFATYTSNWFVDLKTSGERGVTFYFAWSLATEEQFYLFWPPVMGLLLVYTRRHAALVAAALVLLVLQMMGVAAGDASAVGIVLASMAPAILFGVVFAVLLNDRRSFTVMYRIIGLRWIAPASFLLLLACLQVGAPINLSRLLMAVVVASVCVREDTWFHPVLRWRPLPFVGMISYGIYLMHMLSANLVRKLLHHEFGIDVFVCTLAVATLAAYLSYRYFESPLLALKSRFSPGRKRSPTLPASVSPSA